MSVEAFGFPAQNPSDGISPNDGVERLNYTIVSQDADEVQDIQNAPAVSMARFLAERDRMELVPVHARASEYSYRQLGLAKAEENRLEAAKMFALVQSVSWEEFPKRKISSRLYWLLNRPRRNDITTGFPETSGLPVIRPERRVFAENSDNVDRF